MAKLKAPLMSLGASGALGKALVFFPWKGLDVVREYVVPANPKSTGQTTQRGYLAAAVLAIHDAMALAVDPLNETDKSAYSLLGSLEPTPRTWFNTIVKQWLDQKRAGLFPAVYRDGEVTPGVGQLVINLEFTEGEAGTITAGTINYGTSKTALLSSMAAVVTADVITGPITGLVAGTKYYWQFRPTLAAGFIGARSGIYFGTPT